MKLIRNIVIGVGLILSTLSLHALDRVYTVPVQLNASGATETTVVVSTGTGGSAVQAAVIVLAANANRSDFDIELESCTVTSSRVYYAYDAGFNLALSSNTTADWIDYSTKGDPTTRVFRKPQWIMPVGAIYAVTDGAANSCILTVREWVNTSPLFQ